MIINKLSKVTGFSPKLLLGYFGVLIFMMGKGLNKAGCRLLLLAVE